MKRLILLFTLSQCQPCPAGITADTLFSECRGESKAGRMAVASVIFNRAKGNPAKLETVCLAPKQFSCWNKGYTKPKPRNAQERAILAEFEGMEKAMKAGAFKPSGAWTHYHTLKVRPAWSKWMKNRTVIGNHVFGNTK